MIQLTKEVLESATISGGKEQQQAPVAAITQAPEIKVTSTLSPKIAEQIRIAQQRSALAGQGQAEWAIGADVQARHSVDGLWYDGTVTGISIAGKFIVTFDAHKAQEEVGIEDVRQHGVTGEPSAGYKGVQAPKRNVVKEDAATVHEPPAWMQIKQSGT